MRRSVLILHPSPICGPHGLLSSPKGNRVSVEEATGTQETFNVNPGEVDPKLLIPGHAISFIYSRGKRAGLRRTATYLRHAMTKEGIRMCTKERGTLQTEYWSYWIHETSGVDYSPKRTGTDDSMRRLEDLEALGEETPPGWTSEKGGVGLTLSNKGDGKGYKGSTQIGGFCHLGESSTTE